VVDLQCNLRSWAIRRKKAPEILRYAKHRIEKLALVWFKMRCVHIGHVAERYIQALAPLDVVDDGDGLELWLPDERGEAVYPPRMRSVPDTPALGIAPGARHATKQWIPDNFIALAQTFQKRGWQIILLGSAAERTLCASIARQLESSLTLDVSGSSLYDSVRAVDHCCVVVANDSAVVHLAAARRIPVVTIYGSTVPELGFTPFRVPHRVVEANVWCRPCSHIGRARCPLGHFACMRAITPHRVIAAVEELSRA
ncbi:MAG: glycosyltransferase family 9 protein, partial [Chlorobi bacterium]|nr:glycosyltransferase family 9 protein [Chlorobiota bacterium]